MLELQGNIAGIAALKRPRVPWLLLALLALLAFPFLETLFLGQRAPHLSHDVFDDGVVTRLGVVASDWARYGLSLWNPHLTAGNAHLVQFVSSPFAVDALLALVIPPFWAYLFRYFLVVLLAGASIWIFLSGSLRLARQATLAGTLLYVLGFWHYGAGFSAALLPLVLWLSDRIEAVASGRLMWTLWCSLLVGFLFYNGNAQTAVWTGALHLGYACFVPESKAERSRRLATWSLAWSLGLALYAPVLLTQLEALPLSVRAIRNDLAWIPNIAAAAREFFDHYLPLFVGSPGEAALSVPLPDSGYGTWYVGPLALLLLSASVGITRASRREKLVVWLVALIPLLDLFALTVLLRLQSHLGPLRSFQFIRIRLFMPFALAANVAIAMACLQRTPGGVWSWLSRHRLRAAVWTLLFAIQATLCGRALVLVAIRRRGGEGVPTMMLWTLTMLYFAGGVALALALLRSGALRPGAWSTTWGRRVGATAGTGFVLILGLDRFIYSRLERGFYRQLASFEQALGETPAIRFLKVRPNKQAQRVLTIVNGPIFEANPNRLMFHGLFCADGYENIYPLRYHRFFGLLTDPHLRNDPAHARGFWQWGQRAYAWGPEVALPLANLAGIRWIYSARGTVLEAPFRQVFKSGSEVVYENPSVFPRAFLVDCARRFPDQNAVFAALASATSDDLRACAFVETPDVGGVPEIHGGPRGTAELHLYSPDRVTVDVDAPAPGLLVLGDALAPGWIVRVGGVRKELLAVDGAFRGVVVPAGRSFVDFVYVPTATRVGAWVAAAALVAIATTLVFGRRVRVHS